MSFFQSFDLVGWQHFIKVIRPVKIHFQWFTEILLWALWSNHNKSNPQKQRLVKRNWMFCCLCAYHCTPWWRGYQCQHVCTRWLACSVGHPTHWRLGFWLSYSQWSYAENKKRSYRWQTARRTCAMQRCGWPLKPPCPAPTRYRAEFGRCRSNRGHHGPACSDGDVNNPLEIRISPPQHVKSCRICTF